MALEDGHDAVITALLDAKADVNLASTAGQTPLHHAAGAKSPGVVVDA